MGLTISQMARMSQLLDETLGLDAAGRRAWLERACREHADLAVALREALLPEAAQAAELEALSGLPKLGGAYEVSTAAASGLKPGARVGPYELMRLLGAGGMAEVWLARRADGAFKREVALKLPMRSRPEAGLEARFARERDILASLEHPHIARLYDAGVDAHVLPYLAMEYVQGEPLTHWCDARWLGIPERLRLFLQVLEAVQYAHAKHVVHRDLKPSNILVTDSAQVRLLDFGVARLFEAEKTDQPALTGVYGRALTPDYASPELLRGDPVDERSDLYSLGVLLYELLTGTRPYRLKSAASIGALDQAIVTLEAKKPSTHIDSAAAASRGCTADRLAGQLRGDLDAIALTALAKDPAQRYPNAASLAEDLRRFLDGKPIQARPARISYRVGKFVRRNLVLMSISVAALAAILLAVGYALYRESLMQVTVSATALANSADAKKLVNDKSIAVLPFVDLSEKKDQEYFSDGLSDELIDLLARVPDLRVPARTSSFYFKGKQVTIADIAKALGVAHVLEGSVRKGGDTLRITVQLIQADNGYHLWSKTYDRGVTDIFKVQDEIAAAVVEALKAKLLPTQPILNTHYTDSTDAYDQYLLGRQSLRGHDRDSVRLAVGAFQRAVSLDANFAAAYAGLAEAEAVQADVDPDQTVAQRSARLQRARAAAERAVSLAPELLDGYAVRGWLRFKFLWDWNGGRADLERAMAYDPRDSISLRHYSELLGGMGLLTEAIAAAKKATDTDPLSVDALIVLGTWRMNNHDFAAARDAIAQALKISPNSLWAAYINMQTELLDGHAQKTMELAQFNKPLDQQTNFHRACRSYAGA